MKQLFISIVCITLLLSCSKNQRTINKLQGTWEIVTYKQGYLNGLTSVIDSQGDFIFSDFKIKSNTVGTFSRSQNFQIDGIPSVISEQGNYSIFDDGKGITLQNLKSDGSFMPDLKMEINIITSTDLILVGVINNTNQTFILKKKE